MHSGPTFAARIAGRALWELRKAQDFLADVRLGIKTTNKLPDNFIEQLVSRNRPNEATHYISLKIIARRLHLGADDTVFDIGCGYGRPLCYFATLGVRKCVGIELDPDNAVVARRNLARLPVAGEVIVGDACAQDYSEATAIYMFNPFDSSVLTQMLAKLQTRHDPRLRICYVNPLERSVLDEARWLRLADEFSVPCRGHYTRAAIWTTVGS